VPLFLPLSTQCKKHMGIEQTTIYQQHLAEQAGSRVDGRLLPSEVDLAVRSLPRDARGIYSVAVMRDLWEKRGAKMQGEKGDVLRTTLEGENIENDFIAISRTVGFLYETIQRGEEIDVQQLAEHVYDNRAEFFPEALLEMASIGPDQVSGSHQGRNPLLHTCYDLAHYVSDVVNSSEVSRQPDETIFIEIMALILHDFGKLFDPKDPSHGSGSVVWSEQWLTQLAETIPNTTESTEVNMYRIRFLMRFHDVPGNIDLGNLTVDEAVMAMVEDGYLPSQGLMLSLRRIQEADMAGTPGIPAKFRKKNREYLADIQQRILNLKREYGFDDEMIPTEALLTDDANLVDELFRTIARARESVSVR
jgi:hypothetical protein